MERQFLVSVLAAVAAWWVIERLREMRAGGLAADPVAGIAANEAVTEMMV